MIENAENKLTKAKAKLVRSHPFYAIIAFGVDYIEAPWCDTMATDGINIFWGREFVDKITEKELMGVIAHEVLHIAWLHPTRCGPRDPTIWNYAIDVVVNEALVEGKFSLPPGVISTINPQLKWLEKYHNWSANAVYEDMMKNATKVSFTFPNPNGKKGENQTWGGVFMPMNGDGKPLTKEQIKELEEETKLTVQNAAMAAKARGKLPGSLSGLIEAVGKPKIDWKDYIQNWVTGHHPDDYSWAKPNRKWFVNHRIYMPRIKFNGAGHGVLSIDTSGSVSDKELQEYVREVAGVIELCNPDKLTIIQHDAVITDVREWEAGEDFKNLHVKGRGGTCIQPSFEYVKKMSEPVDWMICMTDMGIVDFPDKNHAPDFPVLWCATGPDIAPFGTYLPLRDGMDG